MCGVFAEFERSMIVSRVNVVKRASADGKTLRRPRTAGTEGEHQEGPGEGGRASEDRRRVRVGSGTVQRIEGGDDDGGGEAIVVILANIRQPERRTDAGCVDVQAERRD